MEEGDKGGRPVDSAPLRKVQLERWEAFEKSTPIEPRPASAKHNGQEHAHVTFGLGTQLLSAAGQGDAEDVRELVARGADPNTANADGLTPLHQVCIDNHKDLADLLITLGANVNAADNEGWTPLHAAVSCGHASVVRVLFKHHANMLAVNVDEQIPSDVARETHGPHSAMYKLVHEEMDRRGIDDKAIQAAKDAWTSNFAALVRQHCAALLSDKNMARQRSDPSPSTATATRAASASVLSIDPSNTATSNTSTNPTPISSPLLSSLPNGATLLHFAACHDFLDAAQKLVEAGANVNAQDDEGWTPLHAAVHWNQREIAHFLVAVGADVNVLTKNRESLEDVADDTVLGTAEFLNSLTREAEEYRVKEKDTFAVAGGMGRGGSVSHSNDSLQGISSFLQDVVSSPPAIEEEAVGASTNAAAVAEEFLAAPPHAHPARAGGGDAVKHQQDSLTGKAEREGQLSPPQRSEHAAQRSPLSQGSSLHAPMSPSLGLHRTTSLRTRAELASMASTSPSSSLPSVPLSSTSTPSSDSASPLASSKTTGMLPTPYHPRPHPDSSSLVAAMSLSPTVSSSTISFPPSGISPSPTLSAHTVVDDSASAPMLATTEMVAKESPVSSHARLQRAGVVVRLPSRDTPFPLLVNTVSSGDASSNASVHFVHVDDTVKVSPALPPSSSTSSPVNLASISSALSSLISSAATMSTAAGGKQSALKTGTGDETGGASTKASSTAPIGRSLLKSGVNGNDLSQGGAASVHSHSSAASTASATSASAHGPQRAAHRVLSRVQEAVLRFNHVRRPSASDVSDPTQIRRRSSIIRTGTSDKRSIAADDRKREYRVFQSAHDAVDGGAGSPDPVGTDGAAAASSSALGTTASSSLPNASGPSAIPTTSTTSASTTSRTIPGRNDPAKSVAVLAMKIEQRKLPTIAAAPGKSTAGTRTSTSISPESGFAAGDTTLSAAVATNAAVATSTTLAASSAVATASEPTATPATTTTTSTAPFTFPLSSPERVIDFASANPGASMTAPSPYAATAHLRQLPLSPAQRAARAKRIRESRRTTMFATENSVVSLDDDDADNTSPSVAAATGPDNKREAIGKSDALSRGSSASSLASGGGGFRSPPHGSISSLLGKSAAARPANVAGKTDSSAPGAQGSSASLVSFAPPPTATALPTSSSLEEERTLLTQSLGHLERRVDEMDLLWAQHRDQTYDAIETIRQRLAAISRKRFSDV